MNELYKCFAPAKPQNLQQSLFSSPYASLFIQKTRTILYMQIASQALKGIKRYETASLKVVYDGPGIAVETEDMQSRFIEPAAAQTHREWLCSVLPSGVGRV